MHLINENAEDLDNVMPMCNLLEYSKNYSKTSGSFWNYYRDELTDDINENNNPNKNVINSKSFKYKISITGSTYNVPRRITGADGSPANNLNYDRNKRGTKEVEITVPLKHLENFWNSLNIPLSSCEVSLTLSWSENCVITRMKKRLVRAAPGGNLPVCGDSSESAAFKIKDYKLYVSVVTLSAENENELLEQLKTGFKRTITWNKYRGEMSNQTKNNSLNYLIDPTFTNVNRLFVLFFENEDGRTSISKYYVPKVDIKDSNVLIDGKPVFEIPAKNKEEAFEAVIEMTKNNNYTTGSLLDYEYFKDHYKLIATDLSKQIELENTDLKQQINFISRLEENNATMFFII